MPLLSLFLLSLFFAALLHYCFLSLRVCCPCFLTCLALSLLLCFFIVFLFCCCSFSSGRSPYVIPIALQVNGLVDVSRLLRALVTVCPAPSITSHGSS